MKRTYFVSYRIEDINEEGIVKRHSKGNGIVKRKRKIKDLTSIREEILIEAKKLKPYYDNMEIQIEILSLI